MLILFCNLVNNWVLFGSDTDPAVNTQGILDKVNLIHNLLKLFYYMRGVPFTFTEFPDSC